MMGLLEIYPESSWSLFKKLLGPTLVLSDLVQAALNCFLREGQLLFVCCAKVG